MPHDTTARGDAADRPGAMTDILRLSFGDVPGGESGMQLFGDHLIHGWDLAVGIGGLTELDPDAVAACLSWFAEQEDAHRSAGAVGPRPEPEWPWARAGLAPKETADAVLAAARARRARAPSHDRAGPGSDRLRGRRRGRRPQAPRAAAARRELDRRGHLTPTTAEWLASTGEFALLDLEEHR